MDAPAVILLTRTREDSERTAREIRERTPAEILIAPLVRIVPVGEAVDTDGHDGLIFTSSHAVDRVKAHRGFPAYCVGNRTAEAAGLAGFDAVSFDGDADTLVSALLAGPNPGRLLHVRGDHSRGDVSDRLNRGGIACSERIAYRQEDLTLAPAARRMLGDAGRIIAPAFSPLGAKRLARELSGLPGVIYIAISKTTASELPQDTAVLVADRPDRGAVLDCVISALPPDSSC